MRVKLIYFLFAQIYIFVDQGLHRKLWSGFVKRERSKPSLPWIVDFYICILKMLFLHN